MNAEEGADDSGLARGEGGHCEMTWESFAGGSLGGIDRVCWRWALSFYIALCASRVGFADEDKVGVEANVEVHFGDEEQIQWCWWWWCKFHVPFPLRQAAKVLAVARRWRWRSSRQTDRQTPGAWSCTSQDIVPLRIGRVSIPWAILAVSDRKRFGLKPDRQSAMDQDGWDDAQDVLVHTLCGLNISRMRTDRKIHWLMLVD